MFFTIFMFKLFIKLFDVGNHDITSGTGVSVNIMALAMTVNQRWRTPTLMEGL